MSELVMFSGGVCSWFEGYLTALNDGPENVELLFADTYMEDEDLYRFLVEASANVKGLQIPAGLLPLDIPPLEDLAARKVYLDQIPYPGLIRIADGRTPWEVMRDEKLLASTRMDACSKILKRELLDRWTRENRSPENCTLHFGLDWTELPRLTRLKTRKAPWRVESYSATHSPLFSKEQMLSRLRREGIKPPRLYGLGFPHNNCGGFCVKAGQAHFALLLRTMPERFAYHESNENSLRDSLGWRQTILRDAKGGKVKPITLTQLRERIEANETPDMFDWGGCGCAIDDSTGD
jgi:hypothetical protein